MAYQIAAMVIGLMLVSAGSLWGLNALYEEIGKSLETYEELRYVNDLRADLKTATTLMNLAPPQRDAAKEVLRAALAKVELYAELREADSPAGSPAAATQSASAVPGWLRISSWLGGDDALRFSPAHEAGKQEVRVALNAALAALDEPPPKTAEALKREVALVDEAHAAINTLSADIRASIESKNRSALAQRQKTLITMAALSGLTVLGAALLGLWYYRGVIVPLSGLAWAVRMMRAGRFADRIDLGGRNGKSRYPEEFDRLADDFNHMAAELDEFYRELEAKVAAKSKELVRSERLASVGYLAAGVAHEINNPLGIIAGYAEYALQELKQRGGRKSAEREEIEKTLGVICEEAFRCKEITSKLLTLAKPGEDARRTVNLAEVAASVASMVGGVKPFRDKRLSVRAEGERDQLVVTAVEAEMKQVILNLAVNALEAVPTEGGEVRIHVARRGNSVELTVIDNGRGMSSQTLDRIFEPFYTEKRGTTNVVGDGQRRSGTGLGLSITHAIVEAHGGRIAAHSEGPGKGSRFIVRLPAGAGVNYQPHAGAGGGAPEKPPGAGALATPVIPNTVAAKEPDAVKRAARAT